LDLIQKTNLGMGFCEGFALAWIEFCREAMKGGKVAAPARSFLL